MNFEEYITQQFVEENQHVTKDKFEYEFEQYIGNLADWEWYELGDKFAARKIEELNNPPKEVF